MTSTDIANTDKFVNNQVVNALLEAIFDILDKDGKRSILKFAGREDLMHEKLPEGFTSRQDFAKLLNAMRILLEFSSQILFEIGRKFSVYLDPFGTNIQEFLKRLNESFTGLKFILERQSDTAIIISIMVEGVYSEMLTDPWVSYFYRGVFLEAVRKSIGGKVEIEQIGATKEQLSFKIQTENNCN